MEPGGFKLIRVVEGEEYEDDSDGPETAPPIRGGGEMTSIWNWALLDGEDVIQEVAFGLIL